MPKLFAAKTWPCLIDIYSNTKYQDPLTGEIVTNWNYLEPNTLECTIVSLRPDANIEQFGTTYTDKEFLRVEVKPDTRLSMDLSMQAGNLREKGPNPEEYYVRSVTGNPPQVFNISGMTPTIDPNGDTVAYLLFLEQISGGPASGAIAKG